MFDANEIFSSVDLMNLSNLQRQNVSTLAFSGNFDVKKISLDNFTWNGYIKFIFSTQVGL